MRFLALTALVISCVAMANENTSTATLQTDDSNRMAKKLGVSLGVVGDPYPSILGVNVAYNALDFLRVKAGYGQIEATTGMSISNSGVETKTTKVTTIGGGLVGFVPGWSLSPTAGLHFSNVTTDGEGKISVQGFEGDGNLVYGSLGMDWQAASGFNTSVGYNVPFGKGSGTFYASAGWFFDLM